jgi:hypothetical protein
VTEEELMKESRGRSRRAFQMRKQLELMNLCRNSSKTSMKNYLSVLIVLMEHLHGNARLWLIFLSVFHLFPHKFARQPPLKPQAVATTGAARNVLYFVVSPAPKPGTDVWSR